MEFAEILQNSGITGDDSTTEAFAKLLSYAQSREMIMNALKSSGDQGLMPVVPAKPSSLPSSFSKRLQEVRKGLEKNHASIKNKNQTLRSLDKAKLEEHQHDLELQLIEAKTKLALTSEDSEELKMSNRRLRRLSMGLGVSPAAVAAISPPSPVPEAAPPKNLEKIKKTIERLTSSLNTSKKLLSLAIANNKTAVTAFKSESIDHSAIVDALQTKNQYHCAEQQRNLKSIAQYQATVKSIIEKNQAYRQKNSAVISTITKQVKEIKVNQQSLNESLQKITLERKRLAGILSNSIVLSKSLMSCYAKTKSQLERIIQLETQQEACSKQASENIKAQIACYSQRMSRLEQCLAKTSQAIKETRAQEEKLKESQQKLFEARIVKIKEANEQNKASYQLQASKTSEESEVAQKLIGKLRIQLSKLLAFAKETQQKESQELVHRSRLLAAQKSKFQQMSQENGRLKEHIVKIMQASGEFREKSLENTESMKIVHSKMSKIISAERSKNASSEQNVLSLQGKINRLSMSQDEVQQYQQRQLLLLTNAHTHIKKQMMHSSKLVSSMKHHLHLMNTQVANKDDVNDRLKISLSHSLETGRKLKHQNEVIIETLKVRAKARDAEIVQLKSSLSAKEAILNSKSSEFQSDQARSRLQIDSFKEHLRETGAFIKDRQNAYNKFIVLGKKNAAIQNQSKILLEKFSNSFRKLCETGELNSKYFAMLKTLSKAQSEQTSQIQHLKGFIEEMKHRLETEGHAFSEDKNSLMEQCLMYNQKLATTHKILAQTTELLKASKKTSSLRMQRFIEQGRKSRSLSQTTKAHLLNMRKAHAQRELSIVEKNKEAMSKVLHEIKAEKIRSVDEMRRTQSILAHNIRMSNQIAENHKKTKDLTKRIMNLKLDAVSVDSAQLFRLKDGLGQMKAKYEILTQAYFALKSENVEKNKILLANLGSYRTNLSSLIDSMKNNSKTSELFAAVVAIAATSRELGSRIKQQNKKLVLLKDSARATESKDSVQKQMNSLSALIAKLRSSQEEKERLVSMLDRLRKEYSRFKSVNLHRFKESQASIRRYHKLLSDLVIVHKDRGAAPNQAIVGSLVAKSKSLRDSYEKNELEAQKLRLVKEQHQTQQKHDLVGKHKESLSQLLGDLKATKNEQAQLQYLVVRMSKVLEQVRSQKPNPSSSINVSKLQQVTRSISESISEWQAFAKKVSDLRARFEAIKSENMELQKMLKGFIAASQSTQENFGRIIGRYKVVLDSQMEDHNRQKSALKDFAHREHDFLVATIQKSKITWEDKHRLIIVVASLLQNALQLKQQNEKLTEMLEAAPRSSELTHEKDRQYSLLLARNYEKLKENHQFMQEHWQSLRTLNEESRVSEETKDKLIVSMTERMKQFMAQSGQLCLVVGQEKQRLALAISDLESAKSEIEGYKTKIYVDFKDRTEKVFADLENGRAGLNQCIERLQAQFIQLAAENSETKTKFKGFVGSVAHHNEKSAAAFERLTNAFAELKMTQPSSGAVELQSHYGMLQKQNEFLQRNLRQSKAVIEGFKTTYDTNSRLKTLILSYRKIADAMKASLIELKAAKGVTAEQQEQLIGQQRALLGHLSSASKTIQALKDRLSSSVESHGTFNELVKASEAVREQMAVSSYRQKELALQRKRSDHQRFTQVLAGMRSFKDELIRQDQARHMKEATRIQERQAGLSGWRDKMSEAINALFTRMAKLRAFKAQTHGKMDAVISNLYGELEAEKGRSKGLLDEIEALKKQQAHQHEQKDEILAEKDAALSKLKGQIEAYRCGMNEKERKQLELISELGGRRIYLTDMIRTLEANRAAKQAQDNQLKTKIEELEEALEKSLKQSRRLEELNAAARAAHKQHLEAQSAGLKRAHQKHAEDAMKKLEAHAAELKMVHQKEIEVHLAEMKKLEAEAAALKRAHLAELEEAARRQAARTPIPPARPKTPVIQVVSESTLYEEVVADLIDELAGCKAELISALGLVKGLLGSEYGLLPFEADEHVAIEAAKYMHEYQAAVIREKAPTQRVVPQIQVDDLGGDTPEEGEPASHLNLSIPVLRQGQRKVRGTQK